MIFEKMVAVLSTVLALFLSKCDAFVPSSSSSFLPVARQTTTTSSRSSISTSRRTSSLQMANKLDLVTYLRTEWVSAALVTNQIPREADVALQLGTDDGRIVTFIPRTIRELITSSDQVDGKLPVSTERQLRQQKERRGTNSATISYVDQRADNLSEVDDESVDVVISLQAAARMNNNGLDWKKSIREAARVLKPGGRFLFVEQTELDGINYVSYVTSLYSIDSDDDLKTTTIIDAIDDDDDDEEEDSNRQLIFEEGGFDDVNLVLTPHVAGVAVKSMNAGLTSTEIKQKEKQQQQEQMADITLQAFERGIKKHKRKKGSKKKKPQGWTRVTNDGDESDSDE